MSAPTPLRLEECPVFPGIARASIAFAFQVSRHRRKSPVERSAFRVSEMYREIFFGGNGTLAEHTRKRIQLLFGPSRSFLDDITTGIPGVNGRPLMMSASFDSAENRNIILSRTHPWDYEYENVSVYLDVSESRRRLDLTFQDHFCIFESGHIFYILALSHHGPQSPFDEYSIIQTQQLALDKSKAASDFLSIERDGTSHSLIGFVQNRLDALPDPSGHKRRDGCANAIDDVLRPFGILGSDDGNERVTLQVDGCEALCNAIVQIEDKRLFDTAMHAYSKIRVSDHHADNKQSPASSEGLVSGELNQNLLSNLHKEWRDRRASIKHSLLHDQEGFGDIAPDLDAIPRPLLAFAGIAQGVPDFPRQDEFEIHDSTRPVSVALENLFYVHPAFELAVGKNWRTFREAQETVGGCPYALLTWIIAVHDELVVSDMETMIEEMLFDKVDANIKIGPVDPAADLVGLLDVVHRMWPQKKDIIRKNLKRRLNIFRWCSIHQSGKIFRYQTERELLESIRTARGTRQRFEDAHAMIDRYENLVEDVSTLAASYAAKRTNFLLLCIALLGLAGLTETFEELFENLGLEKTGSNWATGGVIVVLLCAYWGWNRFLSSADP